jgi:propionate catabolism operon transcriptional regulator
LGASEPTPLNIRVIAATHQDLQKQIINKCFREDLYYRLNILRISVPPLRERTSDINSLMMRISKNLAQGNVDQEKATNQVLKALTPQLVQHPWKGNIRELENLVERAHLVSQFPNQNHSTEALFPELFSDSFNQSFSSKKPKESLKASGKAAEIVHIQKVLDSHNGDLAKTAKALGISRSTLWRRLR